MKQLDKGSKELIKRINKSNVLRTIREHKEISRADISKITGLTPATVSKIAKSLIDTNLIIEKGSGMSSGGRKPILLEINPQGVYVIGLDMGTTKLRFGIIDLYGNIVKKETKRFTKFMTKENMVDLMKESIYSLLSHEKISLNNIVGIGIGVHGLVDPIKGISIFAPAFGWTNLSIKEIFEDEFNLDVYIDNDVRVMALGEKWFGHGKNINDFICINIGTGIGSGIYIDGSLYRGFSNGAGEIGHISLEDSLICNCGNKGCLDKLASAQGIVRRFNELKEKNMKTERIECEFNSKKVFEYAVNKDYEATKVIQDTGVYIGKAISSAVNLLNPEMVVIGGGVANSWDLIYPTIKNEISCRSLKNNLKGLKILRTKLGDEAGLIGAGTLVIKNIFDFIK